MSAPTYTVTEERTNTGWFTVIREDGLVVHAGRVRSIEERWAREENAKACWSEMLDLLVETQTGSWHKVSDWATRRDALIAKITGTPIDAVREAQDCARERSV